MCQHVINWRETKGLKMKAFFDKRIPHPEFNAAGLENEIWKDTAGFTRLQIRTAVSRSRLERKAGAVAGRLSWFQDKPASPDPEPAARWQLDQTERKLPRPPQSHRLRLLEPAIGFRTCHRSDSQEPAGPWVWSLEWRTGCERPVLSNPNRERTVCNGEWLDRQRAHWPWTGSA